MIHRGIVMAKPGQGSFLEAFAAPRLGRNEVLTRIEGAVRWYRFEKLLHRLKPEGVGRPPYEPLLMFKALLLQQWYALSDAELEEALNDRVSFRRFLGLGLEDNAPDHTTLCRFRNRLIEENLTEKLFSEFDKQMEERGLVLKKGTMLDATLVAAAGSRPTFPSDPQEASDPDARFTARDGKQGLSYGYKAHVGVDQGTRIIRSAKLTPANVNETTVADELIRFDEKASMPTRPTPRLSGASGFGPQASKTASCTKAGAAGRSSRHRRSAATGRSRPSGPKLRPSLPS
jgi:IS5 family transposase